MEGPKTPPATKASFLDKTRLFVKTFLGEHLAHFVVNAIRHAFVLCLIHVLGMAVDRVTSLGGHQPPAARGLVLIIYLIEGVVFIYLYFDNFATYFQQREQLSWPVKTKRGVKLSIISVFVLCWLGYSYRAFLPVQAIKAAVWGPPLPDTTKAGVDTTRAGH